MLILPIIWAIIILRAAFIAFPFSIFRFRANGPCGLHHTASSTMTAHNRSGRACQRARPVSLPLPGGEGRGLSRHSVLATADEGEQSLILTGWAKICLCSGYLFSTLAFLVRRIHLYFTFQTICSWCKPRRRLSGFPWAKIESHTICPACAAIEHAKIQNRFYRL